MSGLTLSCKYKLCLYLLDTGYVTKSLCILLGVIYSHRLLTKPCAVLFNAGYIIKPLRAGHVLFNTGVIHYHRLPCAVFLKAGYVTKPLLAGQVLFNTGYVTKSLCAMHVICHRLLLRALCCFTLVQHRFSHRTP